MPFPRKIVLHCPKGYELHLDDLVSQFVRDGVMFVGVVGHDCSKVEDIIDELCVGDGTNVYSMLTSSHPGCTVEEAVKFANELTGEFSGETHVVEL